MKEIILGIILIYLVSFVPIEDGIGKSILWGSAYLIWIKLSMYLGKQSPPKKDVDGNPLPGKKVYDAIENMWDDIEFMKEFAKILSDEGNFDGIINQIIDKDVDKNVHERDLWLKINSPNYTPPSITKMVIKKLMSSQTYNKISNQYKFEKKDDDDFAKLLFIIISKPNFSEVAKIYIFKTLKKSIWDSNPTVPYYRLETYGAS